MLTGRQTFALFGVLAALVGLAAWRLVAKDPVVSVTGPTAAPSVTTPAIASSPTVTPPTTVAVIASTAPLAPASAHSGALVVALASTDPFVRRKAIDDAVAAKDVGALAELYRVDLAANGYVAAAAIDGVGKLAALLPMAERKEAIRTLDRWLRAESVRDAKEAVGNASIAVDALGETKSKDAVTPLMDALDGGKLPLHVQTRIVQVLDTLDDPRAAPSVQRFLVRVEAEAKKLTDASDALERELLTEAKAAADAVLARWVH